MQAKFKGRFCSQGSEFDWSSIMPNLYDGARVCVHKLRAPDGCDIVWLDILVACINAGVPYEELGITVEEIERMRTNICLKHARKWLWVIRQEGARRRQVNGMIPNMNKWLAKGNLSYSEVGTNSQEMEDFAAVATRS